MPPGAVPPGDPACGLTEPPADPTPSFRHFIAERVVDGRNAAIVEHYPTPLALTG
jgi:hypothetical protein